MVSWEVGTVSVTSKVVTGGAATLFCGTGTGISTGTTGGGARMAAACAGSIMVQTPAVDDGEAVVLIALALSCCSLLPCQATIAELLLKSN